MKQVVFAVFAAVLAVLLSACATNYKAREEAKLERYMSASGEPVKRFSYFRIHSWTPLGDQHVVVWTRPKEGYLLKVDEPCPDLQWTHALAFSSLMRQVNVDFDRILLENYSCRIIEIRPVDRKKLREIEREGAD